MEDLGIDFESFFETEFTSQNLPDNSEDLTHNLLKLKKKIILTDEILRKFSETLAENEILTAEKVKYLEELQCCKNTLLSHLTDHEDCQKKYNQLESRLLTTQQEVDLQTNLVAASDSVTRQYASLVKEKDETLKKLIDENQSLKSNTNDKTEEKKYKKKYNAALKRSNKLSEIIEKSRTSQCSSCQELKSSIKSVKKKGKNEYDVDLGSFSPESSVPASVSSIDTGFESNSSDSDLEEVSQKKIHKRTGLEKTESVISLKNKDQYDKPKTTNQNLCEVPLSITFNSDGNEVHISLCEDNVISKTSGNVSECEGFSSTLCPHCSKGLKGTAEKYVQTRVVKYADSCVEVRYEGTSKSTQTVEEEQVSDQVSCEFQSKGVQTIPVIVQQEPDSLTTDTYSNESDSSSVTQVLKCDTGCQTDVENKQLLQSEVGTQTVVEDSFCEITHTGSSGVLPDVNCSLSPVGVDEFSLDITGEDTGEQNNLFNCVDYYIQPFTPVPNLLSPFPSSPAVEDSVSEMDDEMMSDTTSSPPSEEREFFDEQPSHPSLTKSLSITDSTTQTDDNNCMCHQQTNLPLLDAAVQCGGSEAAYISETIKNQENTVSANKYAMKHRKGMLGKTRSECAEVNNKGQDTEHFWEKLALWLISNVKPETLQKEGIIDMLQGRNNHFYNGISSCLESDALSFFRGIGISKLQSENYQQSSHYKKRKLDPPVEDNVSIKPIVVEMKYNDETMDTIQKRVFQFSEDSDDCGSENDGDQIVSKKSIKSINYEKELERSKLKENKKNVDSTPSKLPLRCKRNHDKRRQSLKRKLASSAHLQVSGTSSGTFTVSLIAECDNRRTLNEEHASHMLPDRNCEVSHIQGGRPASWDALRICTDNVYARESSPEMFRTRSNDVENTVSPDSSNPNLLSCQHETQDFSSHSLSDLSRRVVHPTSNAKNILSVDTKSLHNVPCNKTWVMTDPKSKLLNTVYNQDICESSQQLPVLNFVNMDGVSRNSNEFATVSNDQLTTMQQSEHVSLRHDPSEYLNSPLSSQDSSKTSFHSCDTLINAANVMHLENTSDFPVAMDEQSNCRDADDIPAKVRRTSLPPCENQSFESYTNSSNTNISQSQTVVTSNFNENNTISLGKSVNVQKDICKDVSAAVQGDQILSVLPAPNTLACFTENIKSNEKSRCLLQQIDKNPNREDDPHMKNLNLVNQVHTKESEGKETYKNMRERVCDSHNELMDDTESSLFQQALHTAHSPLIQGQTSILASDSTSDCIKSNEKDKNVLQQVDENRNSEDDPHMKNLNVVNQVYAKESEGSDAYKNMRVRVCGSDNEIMEDAESLLVPRSPHSPLVQGQISILARDLASDDDSSEDDICSSGIDLYKMHNKMENHNILIKETSSHVSQEKSSNEKVSGNYSGGIVTNCSQNSTVLQEPLEDNCCAKITNFGNVQENNCTRLNDNGKSAAELKKQSGIISEVSPTNNFSLNLRARDISKQRIPSGKFQESDVNKRCKLQNHPTEETFTRDVLKSPSNKTMRYRKYCESTINTLVPVKPPSVANEIARKTIIKNTVRSKGLLIPMKTEFSTDKKSVIPSQLLNKERTLPKHSSLEDSPFCRQGMMGRRKIIITSPPISTSLYGTSKHIDSTESTSYSESTKKQQRIAHVPKSIALLNKRDREESSSEEMPISKENPSQLIVSHKRVQRPPVKKTKLQRLKQQYVTQRKRIQNLTLDNSALELSAQIGVKYSVQGKSTEAVNTHIANDSPSLEDIALDMTLSDSDESIAEMSQQCKNKCVKNCKKYLCSLEKEEQNLEENSNKLDHNLGSCTAGDCEGLESLDAERFAVNDYTKEKLQGDLFIQPSPIDSTGNTRKVCGNTIDQNQSDAKEISLWDALNKQKSKKKVNSKSSPKSCKESSQLNDSHSFDNVYNFHSTNTCNSKDPVEMVKEKNEDPENKMHELDSSLLESPLSPPDLSSCETNMFHLPVTIPTSPLHEESSENSDFEVNSRKSTKDINEELESDTKAEKSLLIKINTENSESNVKSKLRSWKRDSNPRLRNFQGPSILQEYFKHYYKGKEKKKKQAPDKKKSIESLFNTYLESEFTEINLTDMVEDCNNVVKGDYRIIVKNVVKYCKYSSREDTDFSNSFPMNSTQQRLFTLVIKLENYHPTIVDEVLKRIGNVTCNINHHRFLPTLYCLARFFTAFCKLRNYKHRAQIFCYDALYCLKVKAHTVLFAVLTAFPECFPNANTPAGDSPIVKAMVCSVFAYGSSTYTATKNLRSYLSNFYGYEIENLLPDHVMQHFMGDIKRGIVPEVEQAILLLAKFKSNWKWTYEKLMKGCLLQMVDDWRNGCVNVGVAALCIKLCAYLAKTPPYEFMDAPPLMELFENLLFSDTSPSVMKEACILSLATLVQMNEEKVYHILKACSCEKHLQNSKCLQNVLQIVMRRRTPKWWSKFLQSK